MWPRSNGYANPEGREGDVSVQGEGMYLGSGLLLLGSLFWVFSIYPRLWRFGVVLYACAFVLFACAVPCPRMLVSVWWGGWGWGLRMGLEV